MKIRGLLFCLFALFVVGIAHAQQTKTNLSSQLNSCIYSNTSGAITPDCVNAFEQAIITAMCGTAQASDCSLPTGTIGLGGGIPRVSNLSALKSTSPAWSETVVRQGYAAAGDAPPLRYTWQASCPSGSPDNVALYVQSTVTGYTSAGCWSAASDPNIDDTTEWGVINGSTSTTCNNVTDSGNTAALQVAVNALGTGHTLRQRGWACLNVTSTAPVVISQPAEGIKCDGMVGFSGGHHDVGTEFTGPAGFISYTYGSTMFKYKSATTQALYGNSMQCPLSGLVVGSNNFGQAFIGVDAYSVRDGYWRVAGAHFETAIFQVDIDTSITEAAGSSRNEYWIYGSQTLALDGSFFICNGTASWDCSQDTFHLGDGIYSGRSPTMVLNGADSEHILNWSAYDNQAGGTACGVTLSAANNTDIARNNDFWYVGFTNTTCQIYAEGTENGKSTPSGPNNIYQLDVLDSTVAPTIGTGAKLNWSTYNTPIGLNYFTQSGQKTSQRTSNGLVTNTGFTSSVAPSSSAAVTFTAAWSVAPTAGAQLYFPTQCLWASIVPNAAAPWHYSCVVSGTTTTLTIFNDSGTVTVPNFIYSVTGN